MQVCTLNTCCKRIARSKRSAGTLCAPQISFACLSVSQEPKRSVHGATMIQHAQACKHMSRGFTRQHAAARSCCADPSLSIITLAHLYSRKRHSFWDWSVLSEKRACGCTYLSESRCIIILASNIFEYCVSLLSLPSDVVIQMMEANQKCAREREREYKHVLKMACAKS